MEHCFSTTGHITGMESNISGSGTGSEYVSNYGSGFGYQHHDAGLAFNQQLHDHRSDLDQNNKQNLQAVAYMITFPAIITNKENTKIEKDEKKA